MLVAPESRELQIAEQVERLEAHMLALPQAECPVVHHFGPGTYIREVTLPAGILAIGHAQRFEQLNIMLTGKVVILDDAGEVRVLQAPMIFVGPPGRKVGYVLETCTWLNVYATDERDIETLEATFLDKSAAFTEANEAAELAERAAREADRADFAELIAQAGFTPEVVRAQSENPADQTPMPPGTGAKVTIRDSAIEGKGVFLSAPVEAGELIGPARIFGLRTPLGRFTNHSKTPNARFVLTDSGDIDLHATRRIAGCAGGGKGEEVTIDYREALALSGIRIQRKEQP